MKNPFTPPAGPGLSRPEILAPAGDPASFRAALASGADAVYLGMARFNARGRADRFRGFTLASCIRAAHDRGARVYVTLNTLIHDDELPAALALAEEAHAAGADAAIVQDAGFAALLAERLPDLQLHGSTQMTIHQPDQAAEAVGRLGLKRVILARECTTGEVAAIAERLRPMGAGVEVFVHGALCFAYSGQCLMSNFAGRRSANRGICAQNCRFDFTAGEPDGGACAEDGGSFIPLPVFDRRTASQLISMKDLAAFESVAALAGAGVSSFKIEGRLKGPSYVAEVVRLYRSALGAWEEGASFSASEAMREAGRVYSRGFTNGYLADRIDGSMRGDKRTLEGEPDAVVLSADRRQGFLVLAPRAGHAVRPGQGYRYAHQRYRGGFRVIAADPAPRQSLPASLPAEGGAVLARVRFGSEASGRRYRRGATGRKRLPPPLPIGLGIFLNDDPEIEKRLEKLVGAVEVAPERETVPVEIEVRGRAGEPLRLAGRTADGRAVAVESGEPLEESRSRPLDHDLLAIHLGRLGGTAYRLDRLDSSGLDARTFLSLPALHALRRDLVRGLDAAAKAAGTKAAAMPGAGPRAALEIPPVEPHLRRTTLSVVVSTPEALAAAFRAGAERVVVEDAALLAGDVHRAEVWRATEAQPGKVWLRLPPIAHDAAADRRLAGLIPEVFPGGGGLAGHLGQLAHLTRAGLPAAADLYLNAYNHRTLEVLRRAGAGRITLSLEVDAKEAARVAARAGAAAEIEVVAGGAVFSMLTRQDYRLGPAGRFLAVSEHGHLYRFQPASGAATTLYEARELVGAEALPFLAGRVDSVRLDLAHQCAGAVEEIAGAYRAALEALWAEPGVEPGPRAAELMIAATLAHRRHAPGGSFAGHLFRGARSLDREPAEGASPGAAGPKPARLADGSSGNYH